MEVELCRARADAELSQVPLDKAKKVEEENYPNRQSLNRKLRGLDVCGYIWMTRMYLCMWMVTEKSGAVRKKHHIGGVDLSSSQGEPMKIPVSLTGDSGRPETWNVFLLCLTSVFSVSLPQMSPDVCYLPRLAVET